MKITSGNLEVIDSGVVRTGTTPEILMQIDDLSFKFLFIDDGGKQDTKFSGDTENKTLTISLHNHNSNFGSGIAEPLHIGSYQGKKLFTSFEVRRPSADFKVWTLEYNYYVGEEN